MSTIQQTDAPIFLTELSGGFNQQLGAALSHVCSSVVKHGNKRDKGKITLTLDIEKLGDGDQVNISHKIDFKELHKHGSRKEDSTHVTPMYVNNDGTVTLMPANQYDMFGEDTHATA